MGNKNTHFLNTRGYTDFQQWLTAVLHLWCLMSYKIIYNSNMDLVSVQLFKKLYNTVTHFYCPSEQVDFTRWWWWRRWWQRWQWRIYCYSKT